MPLHILVFMTHSPILEGKLPHTVFEFLGPTLDSAAFLVTAMLNALKPSTLTSCVPPLPLSVVSATDVVHPSHPTGLSV